MRAFYDTSVLVASLVAAHPHHAAAMEAARGVLSGKHEGLVCAHGLAETYAVLTTLPIRPRISPDAARRLVVENILGRFETVALTAREYERLLEGLADEGISGGATYDAIQCACARKARATRVYTFNVAHFRRVAPDLASRVVAP